MKFNSQAPYIVSSILILSGIAGVGCGESGTADSEKTTDSIELVAELPTQKVRIETNFGDMVVELSNATPGHRDNFIELIEADFYDSLLFHRVISQFMIQGGDPNSRGASLGTPLGMGGPGYQIPAEIRTDHLHFKGALAAARQGDAGNPERKSSGSQFYLVQGRPFSKQELLNIEARNFPKEFGEAEAFKYTDEDIERYMADGGVPFLDNMYTVFGQVIEGLDVIDSIAAVQTAAGDRPKKNVTMAIELID